MFRKEKLPIEERLQRAKDLYEAKERKKNIWLKKQYSSGIYKYARKSAIFFLWFSQLVLIDWLLPYSDESDRISNKYMRVEDYPRQMPVGSDFIYSNREIGIKTTSGYYFAVAFEYYHQDFFVGDTLVILKSFLLRDFKKIYVPRTRLTYAITDSITFRYLPLFLLGSLLSLLFLFIKNIEVIAFAWVIAISTTGFGLFILFYLAHTFYL